MTTEFQVAYAEDVLVGNDVYNLDAAVFGSALSLGGVSWITTELVAAAAHRVAITALAEMVVRALVAPQLWLFVTQGAKLDSRVARHKKLWKSLKAEGVRIPGGHVLSEIEIVADSRVAYFSAVALDPNSIEDAAALLEVAPASQLAALGADGRNVAERVINKGWLRPWRGPGADVVSSVCGADGIILFPVGAFDDLEAGAVAIGKREIVKQMV